MTIKKIVSSLLKPFPGAKKHAYQAYQFSRYITNKPTQNIELHPGVTIKAHTLDNAHGSFWGYYDRSPDCGDNMLYHSYPIGKLSIRNTSAIDIVAAGEIVSYSRAWNWQQGSKLNWINKPDSRLFVHNDYDGKKFIARIVDINNKTRVEIDFPIYTLSRDGSFAISLNFSRLARLRPDYGYFNLPFRDLPRIDHEDGLYWVDITNNRSRLILSLSDLADYQPKPSMKNAWHKVNHVVLSPDDRRFMFFHVWFAEGGKKFARLYTTNINGGDLCLLADDDMVSHCTWRNSKEIICWARKLDHGDKYYLFEDCSTRYEVIGDGILTEDGHPSVSPDGEWLLTDTTDSSASDKKWLLDLLIYHFESQRLIKVGRFFAPFCYHGEMRCDLHPRFSSDGGRVTIDSAHDGWRKMYELDIRSLL